MIYTFSKFYYGFTVTDSNKFLDFDEGGDELTATLLLGNYTPSTITSQIASALNDVGDNTYSVTFDRSTRQVTISADGVFNLRVTTGSNSGNSYYSEIGFTSNKSSASSYLSDTTAGSEYIPQFKFQYYVDANENLELVKTTINESTSGALEIVTYGEKQFFEFDLRYITNIPQPNKGFIKNDPSGLEKTRTFLNFCVRKRPIEMMLDIDKPNDYYRILLESTPESGQGTSYRLKQNFGQLPDYYYTGILIWRLLS